MKTKEKNNIFMFWDYYIFYIGVAIIIIAILFYLGIFNFGDNNFTIYKEECIDIKNNDIYSGCIHGCVEGHVYFEKFNISFYELIKFDGECFDYCKNLSTEQVCDKIEVNEFYIVEKDSQRWYELCIRYSSLNLDCEQFRTKILTKDINLDFLNKNCEDITACRTDYDNKVVCDNPTKIYKCGDYEVEAR